MAFPWKSLNKLQEEDIVHIEFVFQFPVLVARSDTVA
jgi:hypothetical protein